MTNRPYFLILQYKYLSVYEVTYNDTKEAAIIDFYQYEYVYIYYMLQLPYQATNNSELFISYVVKVFNLLKLLLIGIL